MKRLLKDQILMGNLWIILTFIITPFVIIGCGDNKPEKPMKSKYTVHMNNGNVYDVSRFQAKGSSGMLWIKMKDGQMVCYNREAIDFVTLNR